MLMRTRDRPPVVRLPPKSNMEVILAVSARIGAVLTGLVALGFALEQAKFILAPVTTAIVVGLMFGPIATRLERRGWPKGMSAGLVTLLFIAIVLLFTLSVAAPLSSWAARVPQIWSQLQLQLSEWRQPLDTLRWLQSELRDAFGGSTMTVAVEDASPVESMATIAPAVIGQLLLFLASLYFFVATRNDIRASILRICTGRRLRWRAAHVFRDVERLVSRYLLSIALINLGLGVAVGIAMYAIGMPSPALWGALAGLMNFIVYIGPAVMALVLFGVGLAEFDTLGLSLLPPLAYLTINMIEAQFVTPSVIGRTMTLNPFMVILALAFWIWMWGPLGGFIAIPLLLICYAVAANLLPGFASRDPIAG